MKGERVITHKLRTFSVRVEAFGHIRVRRVDAVTRREAEEKVIAECGFRVTSREVGA